MLSRYPGLRRLALQLRAAQALYQCRAGFPAEGRAARVLPQLAESDGGNGPGKSLHPGGFPGRDRPGDRGVAIGPLAGHG